MKRKPTSYSDMLKTVLAVKGLEVEDKLFLLAIAASASATGEHAYPGHEALKERTGLGNTTVTVRYRKLEALGLLSLVPSTRKGIAHVYTINLTHEAFPETYIGRIVGNMQESNDDVAAPKVIVGNPQESNDGIVGLKAGHRWKAPKSSLEPATVIVGNLQKTNAYPRLTSHTTSTTTTPPTKTESAAITVLMSLYEESEKRIPDITKQQKIDLADKIRRFGDKIVAGVFKAYLKIYTFSGTLYPFAKFLSGFEAYMRQAEDSDKALGNELWERRFHLYSFATEKFEEEFLQTLSAEQRDHVTKVEAYSKIVYPNTYAQAHNFKLSIDPGDYLPYIEIRKASAAWWDIKHPDAPEEGDDSFDPELPVIPDGSSEESNNE
jgi:hypothetical protein